MSLFALNIFSMDIYMDPLDTLMFVEMNGLSGHILKQVSYGSAMSNMSIVFNKKQESHFFLYIEDINTKLKLVTRFFPVLQLLAH